MTETTTLGLSKNFSICVQYESIGKKCIKNYESAYFIPFNAFTS